MKKQLAYAFPLLLAVFFTVQSCKKCPPPEDDCSVAKEKTLTTIARADNSIVFTNLAGPGACSTPANTAAAYYSYGTGGRVAERKSGQYGPVATLACGDYTGIGYACFKSITSYGYNSDDNVSGVYHQMEQAHFDITAISYDDKVNPLYDACNANYFGDFAYYAPTTLGSHPGNDFYSSTIFQFIPLAKNNPTYLRFEGVNEPGYDSHIIELWFDYEYCNGYPSMLHITQKNTDSEYTDPGPTVTESDGGYYLFNYASSGMGKSK